MLIVKGRPQWWWSKSLFVIKEPHKHVVHDAQGEIDRHACRMNISEKKIISEKKYHKSLLSFLRKQKMGFFFSKLQKVLFCFEIHCSLSRYTLVHLEFPKCLVCAQPGFWGPFPLLLGILLLGNMDPFFFCSLLGVIFLGSFPLRLGIVLLGNMEPFFRFSWVPYFWETNWAFWGCFLRKMKAFPSTSLGCRLVWRMTRPRRFLFFLSRISLANYVIDAKIEKQTKKYPNILLLASKVFTIILSRSRSFKLHAPSMFVTFCFLNVWPLGKSFHWMHLWTGWT